MNLTELFSVSLEGRAGQPALEVAGPGHRWSVFTFGELESRANRMAHELEARGLRRGDRLCAQLANGLPFLDLFLACTRLGVILVPMNTQYRERELTHIIHDAEPRLLAVESSSTAAHSWQTQVATIDELLAGAATRADIRPEIPADGDSPAVIIYTSGTTGTAKGAVLSHNSLAANGRSVVSSWRVTEADRFLAVLPLFHVHGLGNGLHAWLISGCLMRLAERFDHRQAAAQFADFRPTLFFGVPTIYVRMLDENVIPAAAASGIGTAARLFVSGSAPLPPHVMEAFQNRFGHTIIERYGMTEALMIMTNPYDGERRPGTVGSPFPGVDVMLSADASGEGAAASAGADQVEGAGDVGEVWVRSRHLFSGYWRNEEATRAAFSNGWFRSGDLAVRSSDGYYTLRGRKGDVIISGGFNVYPREIEELLLEDAGIREAAVIGVPHDLYGEVPVAYVVTDEALDAALLDSRCRAQLAAFKVPRSFVRVDSLPRNAMGKVQKHLLPAL